LDGISSPWTWDGLDVAHHPVPTGVYFIRLEDGQGKTLRGGRVTMIR